MAIQSAIDEARAAYNKTHVIESTYPNVPGKSLWGSCVYYFDRTASTLNMALNPDHDLQSTPLDVQTWLSAGLTYITVCHKGFELINMTNTMLPVITTSLTELIVNSLAISVTIPSSNTNGLVNVNFSDEYKLADLANEKPDVVVAQHSSGDFTSIQKAVDYAMTHRMPRKRFVIYVKAGIYNEYVEIAETVKYITMYGDGINKTIITGNRHCGGDMLKSSKAGDLQGSATFRCKVTAAPELNPSKYAKAFLGRPWFRLSRTVYMQSFLDGLVDPRGWLDSWGHKDTAYCGEYMNYGPGSSTNQRVNWPHYHAITDPKTAKFFTVAHFISGYNWLPKTGVPFTAGFKNRSVLLN
ncbi:pectinesterase 2 [Helianthus annuus]|uniref:pectinesterase 2 n=1 Tax=Helianthus annuus TaxID=4232 RepID=UPI000B8F4B2F|nr:pectinesterase 2 [Helianthus annuus]